MKAFLTQVVVVVALTAMSTGPAVSAWQEDGIPVYSAPDTEAWPLAIVPDGDNGALILSGDLAIMGGRAHAYTAKISAQGSIPWKWGGGCTSFGLYGSAHMIPDGAGGALFTLANIIFMAPLANVMVGTVGAGGGVSCFCPSPRPEEDTPMQQDPHVVGDGVGGAIAIWAESSTATDGWDVFVQRINSAGTRMWGPNGIVVGGGPDDQSLPRIVSDGSNGAILVWRSPRYEGETIVGRNLKAQRVDSSGVFLWEAGGVYVSAADATQDQPWVVTDGSGGAIVVWRDNRNANYDIYAQRLDPLGGLLWAPDGNAVVAGSGDQGVPRIVSDESGGAIVAWRDDDKHGGHEVYAQRIGPGGGVLWESTGVPVTDQIATDPVNYYDPSPHAVCPDGEGGVIVVWPDKREPYWDVYCQRLDATGSPLWLAGGLAVCTAAGLQNSPMAASDGAGGAIVTWWDDRRGDYAVDLYAQRITGAGVPAAIDPGNHDVPMDGLALQQNQPNPFNPTTTISFVIDKRQHVTLSIYDTSGRHVRTLVDRTMDAGDYAEEWNGLETNGSPAASGVYFIRLAAGNRTLTRKAVLLK